MSKGVNRIFLLGHVGKDPEIRTANSGNVVANFSLAVSDRAKDAQGNWVDATTWFNMVAFQKTAEVVRDYLKKGSQVFIEGKVTERTWDDSQTGQKRYKTEILINELTLLGKPGEKPDTSGYANPEITDDDIPF